jgi:AcrR family transcriptional regulator
MTAPVQRRKPRLSREDWIAAALDAIAKGGLGAVAIEPLAAGLGVTKGSFYAHFSTRDEWIDAALQSWEHSHGHAELDRFAAIDDPTERLHALLLAAVTFSQSGALSVHVGLLGELADERVAGVLARVNASRIRLLTGTYSQLGFSRQRADDRARLSYAAYLGLLQMAREAPGRRLGEPELASFMTEVRSVLIDGPDPDC